MIPGKDSFNDLDKPLFIDAFRARILVNPSEVRCSPLLIISTADLNSKKSARF